MRQGGVLEEKYGSMTILICVVGVTPEYIIHLTKFIVAKGIVVWSSKVCGIYCASSRLSPYCI